MQRPETRTPALGSGFRRLLGGIGRRVEGSPHGAMLLAAVVGLATGGAALLFDVLIRAATHLSEGLRDIIASGRSGWQVALIPAAGGLLAGVITLRTVRETRGQGISDTIVAVESGRGRIRPIVAPARALATALTIGTGGSAGRVGPMTQIGGALGSSLGQLLGLSENSLRLLTASGVAGGVAAMFNAPIAGVFFALEVVLRRITARNFGVVVLAAVVATFVAETVRGDAQAIVLPSQFRVVSIVELPLYALLGVVIAPAAVLFSSLFNTVDNWTRARWSVAPLWLPAVGGLLVGLCGLLVPEILGEGLDTIAGALRGDLDRKTLLSLLALKGLAVVLTLTSGGSGGVFRPALFMGAMLGAAFGGVVHTLLEPTTEEPGAYALAGMSGFFAATTHAPISAVLMLFEMTRDHALVLPLMTTVATATAAARALRPDSIYSGSLRARGVYVDDLTSTGNPLLALRASDAMAPVLLMATPETPVTDLIRELAADPEAVTILQDRNGFLVGVISNADLNDALRTGRERERAENVASRAVRTVYADQTLHEALSLFSAHQVHALPVIERDDPARVIGILRRSDVTQAYSTAVDRAEARARQARVAVDGDEDVRYLELRIGRQSPMQGRSLSDLRLSNDAVVVAVRRGGRTLVPRGTTHLEEGDRVTVITTPRYVEEVRRLLEG